MNLKLEVIVLPVSDPDRAKSFYQQLNFRLDADFTATDGLRVIQMTPPGSPCSIIFGTDLTDAAPGSVQGLHLVVDDIEAARATLAAGGAPIGEIFHDAGGVFHHAGTVARLPGLAPNRASYGAFAAFADPDGNGWVLQEIQTRLPGRVDPPAGALDEAATTAALLDLLKQAAAAHGIHEKTDLNGVYDQHWSEWYAAHMVKALEAMGLRMVRGGEKRAELAAPKA
jgi:catechol 2,3-dioxygenase-like lactoylglutathione lyase family enzyme